MNQHAAPRRIRRSRHDRVLGGVAAGFGEYFGVDAALVRLAFVALAFAGGLGVLLYLAAWVIVPDEPVTEPSTRGGAPAAPTRSKAAWTFVILVTAVLVIAGVGRIGLGLEPRIVWPLALIGFGVALLWLRADNTSQPLESVQTPSEGPRPEAQTADPAAPSSAWSVPPLTESPLRRAAPVLGRMLLVVVLAVAALVVTAAVILALEGPGSVSFTPLEAAITAVAVVVTAVAVGIGVRRVVDALVIATVVVALLALFGWVGPPFHGGFGTRDIRPVDARSIAREYHLAAGELVLDLGDVGLGTQSRSVRAALAAGRLDIVVPDQATVVLDAHVDAGVIDVFGHRDSGVGVARHSVERGTQGTVRVRARVGFGNVLLERASSHRAAAKGRTPAPLPPVPVEAP